MHGCNLLVVVLIGQLSLGIIILYNLMLTDKESLLYYEHCSQKQHTEKKGQYLTVLVNL